MLFIKETQKYLKQKKKPKAFSTLNALSTIKVKIGKSILEVSPKDQFRP